MMFYWISFRSWLCGDCGHHSGLIFCIDCFNSPVFFAGCIRKAYLHLPFHKVKKWNGRFFAKSSLWTILYCWVMMVKPLLMLILCLALIPPWFLYILIEYLHTNFSGVLAQMLLLPTFNCLMLGFLPLALNSYILLSPLLSWIIISLIHWNARLQPWVFVKKSLALQIIVVRPGEARRGREW